MKKALYYISVSTLFAVLLYSCQKDKIITDPKARISFSEDTISFDTIFSSISSKTIRISAINKNDGIIRIDKLQLAKGVHSEFLINVNGIDGYAHSNINIPANDSIILFIKAIIAKNNHDTIAIHKDSIEFFFNNSYQDIDIIAHGQDIHKVEKNNLPLHMSGLKPYAITQSFTISKDQTLIIDKGVRLLMWANTDIIIEGTLQINGTVEEPVYITSHNINHYRKQAAGDWGSIIFKPTSRNNTISNCIISNGVNGLKLETDGEQSVDIEIHNTILQAFSYACLLAENATVKATNCVIVNSKQYSVLISRGGSYSFIHTTIANHLQNSSKRRFLFQASSKDFYKKENALDLKELSIINSIIFSYNTQDIMLDTAEASAFNCAIEHTFLNIDNDLKKEYENYLSNIIYYNNKGNGIFTEETKQPVYFMLDSLSQAKDTANITITKQLQFDINGTDRFADTLPDLGAYEYIYISNEN